MEELDKLTSCYENYLIFTKELLAKASPLAGLFGFGQSPKNHPGHEQFYQEVGECVAALLAASPTEEDAYQAASYIICIADEHRNEDLAYWFLYAAQGQAKPLIPLLSSEHRAQLRQWYDAHHPKSTRMPVQTELYKLLKKK